MIKLTGQVDFVDIHVHVHILNIWTYAWKVIFHLKKVIKLTGQVDSVGIHVHVHILNIWT